MLKSKDPRKGDVVELSNDWQQVGGLLGNVMNRLQVVPADQQSVPCRKMSDRQPERASHLSRRAA